MDDIIVNYGNLCYIIHKNVNGYVFSGSFPICFWSKDDIQYIYNYSTNRFLKYSFKEHKYIKLTYNEFSRFITVVSNNKGELNSVKN